MKKTNAKNECIDSLRFNSPGSRSKEKVQAISSYLEMTKIIPKAMFGEIAAIENLCQGARLLSLEKNSIVFLQGQLCCSYFVIFSGCIDIHHTRDPDEVAKIRQTYGGKNRQSLGPYFARERLGVHLIRISENRGFGEAGYCKETRAASAIAAEPCELLEITGDLYSATLKPFHADQACIVDACEMLYGHVLCQGLSERVLTHVAYRMQAVKYSPRTKICSEGSPIEHLILIDKGAIKVLKLEQRAQIEVSVRIKGLMIGAVELINGSTHYTSSYVSATFIEGFILSKQSFEALLSHKDSVEKFLKMEEELSVMTSARTKLGEEVKKRLKESGKDSYASEISNCERSGSKEEELSKPITKNILSTCLKAGVAFKRPLTAPNRRPASSRSNCSKQVQLFPHTAEPPMGNLSSPKQMIINPAPNLNTPNELEPADDVQWDKTTLPTEHVLTEKVLWDRINTVRSLGEHLGHNSLALCCTKKTLCGTDQEHGTEQLLNELTTGDNVRAQNNKINQRSILPPCENLSEPFNKTPNNPLLGSWQANAQEEHKKKTENASKILRSRSPRQTRCVSSPERTASSPIFPQRLNHLPTNQENTVYHKASDTDLNRGCENTSTSNHNSKKTLSQTLPSNTTLSGMTTLNKQSDQPSLGIHTDRERQLLILSPRGEINKAGIDVNESTASNTLLKRRSPHTTQCQSSPQEIASSLDNKHNQSPGVKMPTNETFGGMANTSEKTLPDLHTDCEKQHFALCPQQQHTNKLAIPSEGSPATGNTLLKTRSPRTIRCYSNPEENSSSSCHKNDQAPRFKRLPSNVTSDGGSKASEQSPIGKQIERVNEQIALHPQNDNANKSGIDLKDSPANTLSITRPPLTIRCQSNPQENSSLRLPANGTVGWETTLSINNIPDQAPVGKQIDQEEQLAVPPQNESTNKPEVDRKKNPGCTVLITRATRTARCQSSPLEMTSKSYSKTNQKASVKVPSNVPSLCNTSEQPLFGGQTNREKTQFAERPQSAAVNKSPRTTRYQMNPEGKLIASETPVNISKSETGQDVKEYYMSPISKGLSCSATLNLVNSKPPNLDTRKSTVPILSRIRSSVRTQLQLNCDTNKNNFTGLVTITPVLPK